MSRLRRIDPADARRRVSGLPPEVVRDAAVIVESVRDEGGPAVRGYAERFGELGPGDPLSFTRKELEPSWRALDADVRALLERATERIRGFAEAQRACLRDLEVERDGLVLGHTVRPVGVAGCYAPGGRFPLPSTVLMTVVPARVAGVESVWVASPNPDPVVRAAAWLAGADGLLAVGGAHAVACLAYGLGPVPASDVVVGPGNVWVTAAKRAVAGDVRIDSLAGPSELFVVADATADPDRIAADLLAQAEHDPQAVPALVALDESLVVRVEAALEARLPKLPTFDVAAAALENGFVAVVDTVEEAARITNAVAPEHLQVVTGGGERDAEVFTAYGALFVGEGAAEVFGDYGAGPNHVLPTGGGGSARGGLSVLDFLRVNTWMRGAAGATDPALVADSERFAELEGLPGHARAAAARKR